MPKVIVLTDNGEVVESFQADEWDLDKKMAKSIFFDNILEAVERAYRIEEEDEE